MATGPLIANGRLNSDDAVHQLHPVEVKKWLLSTVILDRHCDDFFAIAVDQRTRGVNAKERGANDGDRTLRSRKK